MTLEEEKFRQTTDRVVENIIKVREMLKLIGNDWEKYIETANSEKERKLAFAITALFKVVDSLYLVDEQVVRNVFSIASILIRVAEKLPNTEENKEVRAELEQLKKSVQSTLLPLKEQLDQWDALDLRHKKEAHGVG